MDPATGFVAESRWRTLLTVDSFEKAAKLGAITVGALYAVGLLVLNEYLMYWGMSDFSSFRPKCILTGTWTVILLAGCLLPLITPFLVLPSPTLKTIRGVGKIVGSAIMGAMAGLAVDYGVLDTITHHQVSNFLWSYLAGELVFVTGVFLLCYPMYMLADRMSRFKPVIIFVTVTMVVAGVLSFIYGVSVVVYGEVPEALGGGQSIEGRLVLNENGSRFWKQIGGQITLSKDAVVTTESLYLVYQNDRELVLRAPILKNGKKDMQLLVLNRSLVDGFLLEHAAHHYYFFKGSPP